MGVQGMCWDGRARDVLGWAWEGCVGMGVQGMCWDGRGRDVLRLSRVAHEDSGIGKGSIF